jgi:signal recognition particle subunit SRP19
MMQHQDPSLAYKPIPKSAEKAAAAAQPPAAPSSSKSAKKTKSLPAPAGKSGKTQATTKAARRHPYGPPRPPRPSAVPPLDDRLPLHTPVAQTGVAVASVKREIETEKENKRKGISGAGMGEEKPEGAKEKVPKVKRMVVRGKR